ncbi:MAG: glycine/betaine ABC transporter substrate-binding protein [Chthoniobacterales bacterium]|nr:MAG: glycine/betaine ABC transporter substrate-binding protein [Chthoniobacterales bacterium]
MNAGTRSGGLQTAERFQRAVWKAPLLGLLATLCVLRASTSLGEPILVGSKKFTESYVLAEIAKRAMEEAGIPVEHRQGMGGTIILWEALRTDQIGFYPEYTGTIGEEILKAPPSTSTAEMRAKLERSGVGMTSDLGFNNTYALVMQRAVAEKSHIQKISDLRNHPELRFGLTHEFLDRRDGWRPLADKYQLPTQNVSGIDHGLGYAALRNGSIDVKDAYSTDAKIGENDLVVLQDDLQFFPQYRAVFLYRLTLPPKAIAVLRSLVGTLDENQMIRLNAEAERTKNYALAADLYFQNGASRQQPRAGETLTHKLIRWTSRHLELAGISLLLSIIVGIPLGIAASRGGALGQVILGVTSAVQTIPSLALLALLVPVPFFGISPRTAIAALFLYGLLPIVRNTATGLQDIAQPVRESAIALGLEPAARLWKIYLPIASRSILGGIKTSAVINIGTATLAALIGAGGLGEPILSGLNLNDHATILQGAIPAAVLALLVQWSFDLLDRILIPKGLRL